MPSLHRRLFEVKVWINNYIQYKKNRCNLLSMPDSQLNHVSKMGLWSLEYIPDEYAHSSVLLYFVVVIYIMSL